MRYEGKIEKMIIIIIHQTNNKMYIDRTEEFFDIVSFMSHIKEKHGNLSPEQLRDIGHQKKPSLKSG